MWFASVTSDTRLLASLLCEKGLRSVYFSGSILDGDGSTLSRMLFTISPKVHGIVGFSLLIVPPLSRNSPSAPKYRAKTMMVTPIATSTAADEWRTVSRGSDWCTMYCLAQKVSTAGNISCTNSFPPFLSRLIRSRSTLSEPVERSLSSFSSHERM